MSDDQDDTCVCCGRSAGDSPPRDGYAICGTFRYRACETCWEVCGCKNGIAPLIPKCVRPK